MGLADNDDPGLLLAGRRRRGRRASRRGDPRGPPPGPRHLRRERRLRPPRPHPGPPGRHARGRAGRRARAVRDRQGLLEPRPALGRRGRPSRGSGGTCPASPSPGRRRSTTCRAWSTTSGSPPRSTAPRTPPPRPPRCARTPPRSPWPSRTSRSPTNSRSPSSPPSTTSWCAGSTLGASGDGPVRRDRGGAMSDRTTSTLAQPLQRPVRPDGPPPTSGSSCSAPGRRWPDRWCRPAGSRAGCCSRWPVRPGSVSAVRRATGSRAGAVAPAGGWMLAVILLTASRPEGDFVFAAGSGSYLFLLGGMAVAVICATLAQGRQPDGAAVRLGK